VLFSDMSCDVSVSDKLVYSIRKIFKGPHDQLCERSSRLMHFDMSLFRSAVTQNTDDVFITNAPTVSSVCHWLGSSKQKADCEDIQCTAHYSLKNKNCLNKISLRSCNYACPTGPCHRMCILSIDVNSVDL
jgi:hypothetical protein